MLISAKDKNAIDSGKVRSEAEEEIRRLIESIEWALSRFRAEIDSDPRQAFEKAFLAWKAAVALLIARYILENPDPGNPVVRELVELGVVSVSRSEEVEVRVKTSRAVKALKVLKRTRLARYAEELLGVRDAAFRLHSAFYDDPEHSGYADVDEAVGDAKKVIDVVEKVVNSVSG